MGRRRDHWQRINAGLDAERDAHEIGLNLSTLEFPWDTIQSLSFALFRTYAVPSIGELLAQTGEFTTRPQKRYDDTGLLLEQMQIHGLDSDRGRAALRRMNQMHSRYDISNEDLRYVLATFVVVPQRWIERWGYRALTEHELAATTHYYRELGKRMAIRDLPEDFAGFARLLDDYERAHFAYSAGSRAVADATLDLLTTFRPQRYLPRRVVRRLALAVMDEPLLRAFGYPMPRRAERALVAGAMGLRARLIALLPARRTPKYAEDFGYYEAPAPRSIREIAALGTFPGPGHRARSS